MKERVQRRIINNQDGFTLIELLCVTAMIAILVFMAVPTFADTVDKAREATCMDNRRTMQSLISVIYAQEGYSEEGITAAAIAYQAQRAEFVCPEGGTLTYKIDQKTDVVSVYCSIHRPDGIDPYLELQRAYLNLLRDMSREEAKKLGYISNLISRLDSGTKGGTNAPKVAAELLRLGIDLQTYNINAWVITNNQTTKEQYFIWSTYAVQDENYQQIYKQVPVIAYSSVDKTYRVARSNVFETSEKGYSFARSVETGKFGGDFFKEFLTLEEAQAYYDTLSPVLKK